MMKKFLLIVCGSFVGVWLAMSIFFFTAIVFAFATIGASFSQRPVEVKEHSILHLQLSGDISERNTGDVLDLTALLQGNAGSTSSLNAMVASIAQAKENPNIDGIFIDCAGVAASPSTLKELRDAIVQFKGNGKFVYAYAHEGYAQGDYYVASVADSIFLNPVGAVDVHGLASATMYPKKLLDNLGVEMQVVRVGSFKSAVEPFLGETMSEENRMQQEVYLGNIWKTMASAMAESRKIPFETFNNMVDSIIVTMPADTLLSRKIVDKLCYRHEMEQRLRSLTKVAEGDDIAFVSPDDVVGDLNGEAVNPSKVAVLYAVGEIDGQLNMVTGGEGISSDLFTETIYDLIDDSTVKGLVLRVNSPGGSAFGSEQIWKALEDFKKSGKPLAVSMGDYAASGGYYISCGAQRIFAQPTTVTGSIGIFGMIPCTQELAENKLGVYTHVVKTNENSDMGLVQKKLTPVQLAAMQNTVNNGYELFTRRCAEGRHLAQDSIKKIAEGRVWDGATARSIGLVDEIGGLDAAISWVAKKAGLVDYGIQNYPAQEASFAGMFGNYMAREYEDRLKRDMGFMYEYHQGIMRYFGRAHTLCLMEQTIIK